MPPKPSPSANPDGSADRVQRREHRDAVRESQEEARAAAGGSAAAASSGDAAAISSSGVNLCISPMFSDDIKVADWDAGMALLESEKETVRQIFINRSKDK